MAAEAGLTTTLAHLGAQQLRALATGCRLDSQLPLMTETLEKLLGASARAVTEAGPAYVSDVVDDQTPYELSIALGSGDPELRILAEPTTDDHSLIGRWRAARALEPWLRARLGADLHRLDRIADLFDPTVAHAEQGPLLAMWYAVAFRADRPPEVKAYLDLRARGSAASLGLVEEVLDRLELGRAYPHLLREAGRRGPWLDELVYFSLDLAAHARARIKVYFRHHEATAADAERIVGLRGGVEPGEVRTFCATILGDEGPYLSRPLVSCWAFSGNAKPASAAVYAPIAYYVHDDAEARARIHRWLDSKAVAPDPYETSLAHFARRPLAANVGLHSYVGFKRDRGAPKVTTYLAPEAYRTFPPGQLARRRLPPPPRPTSPVALVEHYEHVERIADHPLFRRLEREPPALLPLWAITANNWIGVGKSFARWLAALVARVEDPMRTILAKQLNDELGDGDPTRAHRLLFEKMLADLEPYAPRGDRTHLLVPGHRFAQELEQIYLRSPELEAVGSTLVTEIYGKQVDQQLGHLLRRQSELDVESLTWLVLHETLEEEHADESARLAAMIPEDHEAQEAACRGAQHLALLGYRYFDDLYEVLF
jgi:DMATS type aromatic prenyltransferase